MAVCVIAATVETDAQPMVIRPACTVHTHWAPCPMNGEPASPFPLEAVDGDPGGRDSALARWALKTKRQRPFVLHHGQWTDVRPHDGGRSCWCKPEWFEAST